MQLEDAILSAANSFGALTRTRMDPRLPPGPRISEILQIAAWIRRPVAMMRACQARYGDVFTIRFPAHAPNIFISDPEAIKAIFNGDPEVLHAGKANAILEPIVGTHSLLLLDGARHLEERRLMLPPFHGERMYAYGERMIEVIEEAISGWTEGAVFPLHREFQKVTLEIILRTIFGLTKGARLDRLRAALDEVLTIGANPIWLMPPFQRDWGRLTPWARMAWCRAEIDKVLYEEIADRRASPDKAGDDVLSLLLQARYEDGTGMNDLTLRDQMLTLLVAGHETTATALAWTVSLLIENPESYGTLDAEVRASAVGGALDPARVAKLEYLDATIKEALRLFPVIPVVGRHLQQPTRFAGIDLPADVIATPCIYLSHRDPRRWKDPDRFEPKRFMETRTSPYDFFPFGGGVRRCLGMAFALFEMKQVLAHLIFRTSLRFAPGYAPKLVRRSITFSPDRGLPVTHTRVKWNLH